MGHWLAALLASSLLATPSAPATALAESPLARADGWTRLGFPLGESAPAVGLAIDGRAEFGRVEILFGDGTIERHELGSGRTYGRGVYQLACFGASRRVMLVRLEARARSANAKISAVLLHAEPDALAPAD